MGLVHLAGSFLLSIVGSVLGNKLSRYIDEYEKRRKEKSPTDQSEGS
ncbi:MAG: hypothetical protein FWC70_10125 [Defluviitaleaceae bacterium]|nr:hypothetical protein [Defluviitaleaceae bacterium]